MNTAISHGRGYIHSFTGRKWVPPPRATAYGFAMTIRAVTAQDLDLYRSIRLRALRTDPEAFGSDHDREAAFDDETWLSRMLTFKGQPGAIYLETPDGETPDGETPDSETPDGGAGQATAVAGIGLLEDPTAAIIWGMWVAPEARRTGAARRLLDATLAWATSRSVEVVELDVVRTNTTAMSLYESIGFGFVEDVEREDDDPCADERRMELRLGAT